MGLQKSFIHLVPRVYHELKIENEFLAELNHAAGPLLKLGLYDSPGEFIKDVTSDFIKHKIQFYNLKSDSLGGYVWYNNRSKRINEIKKHTLTTS